MIKSLTFGENLMFALRELYEKSGYQQYRMSKFEEYDLYARNKDFLISDGVITFTDTNGKLMALKPDVTLSIIKNIDIAACGMEKVYYNENVYRISKGTRSFKEIMQIGLECLGYIDDLAICEVLLLAAESLKSISRDWVMDISDVGLVLSVIEGMGVPLSAQKDVLKCLGEKNFHEMRNVLKACGAGEAADKLIGILSVSGKPDTALKELAEKAAGIADEGRIAQLYKVISALPYADNMQIDLSVVGDVNYYNGIVFKGFIAGVPSSVLSGGQYDNLMRKMHKNAGAIGFAIYLDMLERMGMSAVEFDADVFVRYEADADIAALMAYAETLRKGGKSVALGREIPNGRTYREIKDFGKEGAKDA